MLTDAAIKRAKKAEKPQKLWDSGGLYLHVSTSGHKSFRLKYRFAGKEKVLTLGGYPDELTLVQARDARDAAKRELRDGKDPGTEKKRRRAMAIVDAANDFEALAKRWHKLNKGRWSTTHAANVWSSLENDVFPILGSLPINTIDVPLVMSVIEAIEGRGAIETAGRVRQRIEAIFALAVSKGLATSNPAAPVKGAMQPKPKQTKQPAITDLEQLRAMLKEVEAIDASPVTKLANRLLALTAVRPGVVHATPWHPNEFEDLEGDAPLWRIPPERMKLRKDRKGDQEFEHLVPLSWQAVEVIDAIKLLTGRMDYLFPNERWANRPMSENAINMMLKRAGYHSRHVPHGYRSSFSTIMNEIAERTDRPGDRAVIDLMLAHLPKEKVEGAYNRAAYMPRRREIAQAWADMLLKDFPPADALLRKARR